MGHRDGAVEAVGDAELAEPSPPYRQTRRAHSVYLGIAVRQLAHGREHGGGDVGRAVGFVRIGSFEQRDPVPRLGQAPTEQPAHEACTGDGDAHGE